MKIALILITLFLAGCAGLTGFMGEVQPDAVPQPDRPAITAPVDTSPLGMISSIAGVAGSLLGAGYMAYRNKDPKKALRAVIASAQEIKTKAKAGTLDTDPKTVAASLAQLFMANAQKQGISLAKYDRLITENKAALAKAGLLPKTAL